MTDGSYLVESNVYLIWFNLGNLNLWYVLILHLLLLPKLKLKHLKHRLLLKPVSAVIHPHQQVALNYQEQHL